MLFLLGSNPRAFLLLVLAWLVALTVHEFMHAWTANYLGDSTARYSGRVTLNPLAHLDMIGTVMILLIGIGWAKPVPVNENNFRNPRLGSALTSIAGPGSNLVVALILAFFLRFQTASVLGEIFLSVAYVNLILMFFNLIPIPPLDGSKVLYYFLPRSVNLYKLEAYGPFLLLAILFLSYSGGGVLNFIYTGAFTIMNAMGVSAIPLIFQG